MITQTTGDDWNDTNLSLSTAVPSVGGNVPELDVTNVRIKLPPPPPQPQTYEKLLFNFFSLLSM